MSHIVQAGIWIAEGPHDTLEVLIDRIRDQMAAQLVSEYQIAQGTALPGGASRQPPFSLLDLLCFQYVHYKRSRHNGPRLVILSGQGQNIGPTNTTLFFELLIDRDAAARKINTVPGKTADLATPHTRKYRCQIEVFKSVAFHGGYELGGGIFIQRRDFLVDLFGQGAGICGVCPEIANSHGLGQGFVQHAMNIVDCLRV